MDELEKRALEQAITFGKDIHRMYTLLGTKINFFESNSYSEETRRKIATEALGPHKRMVQEFVNLVDTKYSGIKVAEEAKKQIQERLAEFESLALPYL